MRIVCGGSTDRSVLTDTEGMDRRWQRRLPLLLLAAVVAVACGSLVVGTLLAVPQMIPPNKTGGPLTTPNDVRPLPCSTPDPSFVATFSVDPLMTTAPPGATLSVSSTQENCGGANGGVSSTVEGAPPGSQGPVTRHYRALAVAGGWTVADRPTAGALLSATRPWQGRTAYFTLWLQARSFRAEITPVPT